MGITEYGIWSDQAGGFIASQLYSEPEADTERYSLIVHSGEEADDLKVLPICPEHEEQPADTCEGCADEDLVDDDGNPVEEGA